jgi:hypothetical protein
MSLGSRLYTRSRCLASSSGDTSYEKRGEEINEECSNEPEYMSKSPHSALLITVDSEGCVVGVSRAPWRRLGGAMWQDPGTASRISGLPTRTLRKLADEGLLATFPERDPRMPRRYREDELRALKEELSGYSAVSLSLIRRLAGQ